MKPVLLIDFGSTYTKLTAVDVEGEQILGTASAYTTVQTDINDGLALGCSPAAVCRTLPARPPDWQVWAPARKWSGSTPSR